MSIYRNQLPQRNTNQLFITDGGLETTLVFHEKIDLPYFAAFPLLQTSEGEAALNRYFSSYANIALFRQTGLVLESATWRASPDWGRLLGYSQDSLVAANRRAIAQLVEIRRAYQALNQPFVISGNLGPRGDGYVPAQAMTAYEAERYHALQAETFADTEADMLCAMTMNYVEEAVGIAQAARRVRMPVAISFTVETDGRLPTGQTLGSAIEQVDTATDGYPAYYMVNCAHPSHFAHVFDTRARWVKRIQGVRANASRMSHAELNEAPTLDDGDPRALADDYADLKSLLPNLNVLGGCCGTDHRHIGAIAERCEQHFSPQVSGSNMQRASWITGTATAGLLGLVLSVINQTPRIL